MCIVAHLIKPIKKCGPSNNQNHFISMPIHSSSDGNFLQTVKLISNTQNQLTSFEYLWRRISYGQTIPIIYQLVAIIPFISINIFIDWID